MKLVIVAVSSATIGLAMLATGTASAAPFDSTATVVPAAATPTQGEEEPDDPEAPQEPRDQSTIADNEFLPEDRDIGECLGALERPGCGSSERGGWRQAMVFGLIVAAFAVIGWRLTVLVRRRNNAGGSHGAEDTAQRPDGGDDDGATPTADETDETDETDEPSHPQ